MIVPLAGEHVGAVARLHADALAGLLSNLGSLAIRAFYAGCIRTGSAVGFVYLEDGKVSGFVFGSADPCELKRAAARGNPFGTLAGIALGVLRRPSALLWLAKSLRGPDEGSYEPRAAELTYLAVDAGCRRGGIGRRLVETFTEAMRASGIQAYELSVDDDNPAAAAFYEKLGFRTVGRYREFGTLHRRYHLRTDRR